MLFSCTVQTAALFAGFALLASLPSSAHAQIAPHQGAGYLQGEDLIIAPIAGTNEMVAYSKWTGRWQSHTFPEGVSVIPVIGGSTCAFRISGSEIHQLVAVDRKGNWRTCDLEKPSADCLPIIGDDVVVFRIENRLYGFSSLTGTWDQIEMAADPSVMSDTSIAVTEKRMAAFSAQTGTWAVTHLVPGGE